MTGEGNPRQRKNLTLPVQYFSEYRILAGEFLSLNAQKVILLSPAKVNIGLQILRKRTDGFHTISTLMVPLPFRDLIEINPGKIGGESFSMKQSGITVPGNISDHLCFRAWQLFCNEHSLTPVQLHLHKRIPLGAGLGGGSSNAATVLKGLNTLKGDPYTTKELETMAASLGSDCSLFISNAPALAEGRGEILKSSPVQLSGLYMVILYPEMHVDTASAYRDTVPDANRPQLQTLLATPVETWRDHIKNDFERTVFGKFPEIADLKSELYGAGALYASMSGSGSSVFGLFRNKPLPGTIPFNYIAWEGYL